MKYFIVICLILAICQFVQCMALQTEGDRRKKAISNVDYDYSDDADPNDGFDYEPELPRPIYDLKDAPQLFEKYIKDFKKKYNPSEKVTHYAVFVEALKEINEINSNKELSSAADLNLFSDWTKEEKQLYLG